METTKTDKTYLTGVIESLRIDIKAGEKWSRERLETAYPLLTETAANDVCVIFGIKGGNIVVAIQHEDDTFTDRYRVHFSEKNISFIASNVDSSEICSAADVDGYYYRNREAGPGKMNMFFSFTTGKSITVS